VPSYAEAEPTALLHAFFGRGLAPSLDSRVIPGVEVEVLSWGRLLSAPVLTETAAAVTAPASYSPKPLRVRPIFDPETGEYIAVAIHERHDLKPGNIIQSPPSSSKTRPRPSSAACSTPASTLSAMSS
jgi:hypothetical protein